jgi:hypothetical protein
MKEIVQSTYVCEVCGYTSLNKNKIDHHEKECSKFLPGTVVRNNNTYKYGVVVNHRLDYVDVLILEDFGIRMRKWSDDSDDIYCITDKKEIAKIMEEITLDMKDLRHYALMLFGPNRGQTKFQEIHEDQIKTHRYEDDIRGNDND